MQQATDILRKENDKLEGLISSIQETITLAKAGTLLRLNSFHQFNEVLSLYVEGYHQRKEELLYSALEKKGILRQGGLLGVFDQGMKALRLSLLKMKKAAKEYSEGRKEAGKEWADLADFYCSVLKAHNTKEKEVLFPLADKFLDASEQQELLVKYGETRGKQEALRQRIHKLYDAFGRVVHLDRIPEVI